MPSSQPFGNPDGMILDRWLDAAQFVRPRRSSDVANGPPSLAMATVGSSADAAPNAGARRCGHVRMSPGRIVRSGNCGGGSGTSLTPRTLRLASLSGVQLATAQTIQRKAERRTKLSTANCERLERRWHKPSDVGGRTRQDDYQRALRRLFGGKSDQIELDAIILFF